MLNWRRWRAAPVVENLPQQPTAPEPKTYIINDEVVEEYRDEDEEQHLTEALSLQRRAQGSEKKLWLHPAQVAERFVAFLRLHDYCALPHLVDDLDEAIDKWCERNGVEPVPLQQVREAMTSLPGVTHAFKRLSERNPRHAPLIRRLKAMGRGTRATIYTVSPFIPVWTRDPSLADLIQDAPAPIKSKATKKAKPNRINRIEAVEEVDSDRIISSDDDQLIGIGWEIRARGAA